MLTSIPVAPNRTPRSDTLGTEPRGWECIVQGVTNEDRGTFPEQLRSLWNSCSSQFTASYCWDPLLPMKFGCVPLQDERWGFIYSGCLTKMNRHHELITKVDPYIWGYHCKSHYSSSASYQWGKYGNVKHRHEFWVCGTFPDICISGRCVDRFFSCYCILIHLLTVDWNNRSPASFYNSNLSPF